MPDKNAVAVAAMHFAAEWGPLFASLPDAYWCTLTCAQANAAAELFEAVDDPETARKITTKHIRHDMAQEAADRG